jgi:hypothetical protein
MDSMSLMAPSKAFPGRQAIARGALACALVAASLWDFRVATVRLFDLVALISLIVFFALERDFGRGALTRRAHILPFVAVMIAYAIFGYFDFHHRSSFAIVLLALVCVQFAGYADNAGLRRIFRWIVYLNVAVQAVQYVCFYALGRLLDPQYFFGIESRILEAGGTVQYLRPAGLFQEPNSYSLNLFMMAAVVLLARHDRRFAFLSAASMLLTESLWGIVGAFVLLAFNEWNASATFLRKCAALAVVWIVVFVCFNAYIWVMKPASADEPYLYARLGRMSVDPSARDRYGEFIDKTRVYECPECKKTPPTIGLSPQLVKLVGRGLSTAVFYSEVAANGYSFFWYCLGPVGLMLVGAALIWAMLGVALRDQIYIAAAMIFAFTTYPLVTYVIFWLWLPAMLEVARKKSLAAATVDHPAAAAESA